jgi:DNA-directed RNA polymerase subunit beta'
MGAECIMDLLASTDLDALSYELRHKANNETSKQRKTEALKRLKLLNLSVIQIKTEKTVQNG